MEPVKKSAAALTAELEALKALMTRVEERLATFRIPGSNVAGNIENQHIDQSHDRMPASQNVVLSKKTSAAFHFVTTDLNSCLRESRRARNGFRPRKPR